MQQYTINKHIREYFKNADL
ncbi:hypothetical protein MOC29_12860 [Bacillus paralicheniformis]|nr:hypothetical protein [Bacillus paralicheniformis]MCY8180951.1 hypothetical protein [Bacillus paralicheniformis]MCY9422147.1 hypothetical protein [Bacillus paralicheniformis]